VIDRNKYHVMRVTQFVTVLLVLAALQKLAVAGLSGGSIVWPAILLFGSTVVGLTASVLAHYYNSRQDDLVQSQKIAIETLARLGRQKGNKRKDAL
jgi:hypothetical protein